MLLVQECMQGYSKFSCSSVIQAVAVYVINHMRISQRNAGIGLCCSNIYSTQTVTV